MGATAAIITAGTSLYSALEAGQARREAKSEAKAASQAIKEQEQKEKRQRELTAMSSYFRRRGGQPSQRSTILTSPMGLPEGNVQARKTLLGQ